jgi:hypothetical protein
VWHIASGRCLLHLVHPLERNIRCFAFDPRGGRVLALGRAASRGGTRFDSEIVSSFDPMAWDLASGQQTLGPTDLGDGGTMGHHRSVGIALLEDRVTLVHPEGAWNLEQGYLGRLRIPWAADGTGVLACRTGRVIVSRSGPARALVIDVRTALEATPVRFWGPFAVDRQDKQLAGDTGGKVTIYDVATAEVRTPGDASCPPEVMASFFPDGRRLALASKYVHGAAVLDLIAGTLTPIAGTSRAASVAVQQDGKRVLSGSEDGTLTIWSADSGRCAHELRANSDPVSAIVLLPDGVRAMTAGGDGTLCTWDIEGGRLAGTLRAFRNRAYRLVANRDGSFAAALGDAGSCVLVDLEKPRVVARFECPGALDVAVLSRGHAVTIHAGTLRLWSSTGKGARRIPLYDGKREGIHAVMPLDADHVLAQYPGSAGPGADVVVAGAGAGVVARVCIVDGVRRAFASPSGRLVVTSDGMGYMRLFSMEGFTEDPSAAAPRATKPAKKAPKRALRSRR